MPDYIARLSLLVGGSDPEAVIHRLKRVMAEQVPEVTVQTVTVKLRRIPKER